MVPEILGPRPELGWVLLERVDSPVEVLNDHVACVKIAFQGLPKIIVEVVSVIFVLLDEPLVYAFDGYAEASALCSDGSYTKSSCLVLFSNFVELLDRVYE